MNDKFEYIKKKLTDIFAKVTIDNSIGLLDINKRSENIFMHILNSTYNWNLKNANLIQENFPAIDLIDESEKIVVQVTSTTDTKKVRYTIEKLRVLNDYKDYDLKIFYIKNKPKFQREILQEFAKEGLLSDDFLGIRDILEEVESSPDICNRLYNVLQKIFDENRYTIEVNGNIIGINIAQNGSNITQNIYGTVNPEILVTHITLESIGEAKGIDTTEKDRLNRSFYFIDDKYETIFKVVCNNLDVKNHKLLHKLYHTISTLSNASYWLLGNGGEGKSTTLVQLAVESVLKGNDSFYIDFENSSLEEKSIIDILNYIQKNTKGKAYIFIDNPDIKISLLEQLFREITRFDFEFIIILAERKNRYYFLKEHNKNAIYIPNQSYMKNYILLTIPIEIKKEVYKRFYRLLGEKKETIETLINTTINQKGLAYVNATYKILYELLQKRHIHYKFDWLEYKDIAKKHFPSLVNSYKYIALFYYFRIKIPFSFFENLYSKEYHQKDLDSFKEYFLGVNRTDNHKEPIVFDVVKENAFRENYFMRTKHEVIAELFFDDNDFDNKNFTKLLIDILKVFDNSNQQQVGTLIQFFGNKRVITDSSRNYQIDFSFIDEIIKDRNFRERFRKNFNLFGALHLARFWTISDIKEAERFLVEAIENIPDNLHFRTELAKVYQKMGGKENLERAEKRLLESLEINNKNFYTMAELIRVYSSISKPRESFKQIDKFLSQKNLRFFNKNKGRVHQPLFNNLFSLCNKFKYFDKAKEYFEKYSDILDERNIRNYQYKLKDKIFNFKKRDIEGVVSKIGYNFIVIDNHKYSKRFPVFIKEGDKIIFDLDYSENACNIEKIN